jgi:hypothetical protein
MHDHVERIELSCVQFFDRESLHLFDDYAIARWGERWALEIEYEAWDGALMRQVDSTHDTLDAAIARMIEHAAMQEYGAEYESRLNG